MLGFLSTLTSPFARSAVSAEADGAVTSVEGQKTLKTAGKDSFFTFQTAFENSDAAHPRTVVPLQSPPAVEAHVSDESASFEQLCDASDEDSPSDYLHDDSDDYENSRDDAWQPDEVLSGAIKTDQGDAQDGILSASQIAGSGSLSPLSERPTDDALMPAEFDTDDEHISTQGSSQLLAFNQNGDAVEGWLAHSGAHGARLASASIDGIRVQSALLEKPTNDLRAAPLGQAQTVSIPEVANLQDQTAPSKEPVSRARPDQPHSDPRPISPSIPDQVQKDMREFAAAPSGRGSFGPAGVERPTELTLNLEAPLTAVPVSARDGRVNLDDVIQIRGAIAGVLTDRESVPDVRSTAKISDVHTAMAATTEMTRSAIPVAREPVMMPFTDGGISGADGERALIAVHDSAVSGDFGPVSASNTESRVVSMAGGGTPQLARYVAIQLSDAVVKGGERQIDLSLNPAELGRVRITLTPGEGGMVVSVSAERAETLDLMRRHSDVLDQEFRDLGYGGTEFSFSREQDGAHYANSTEAEDSVGTGAALGSEVVKDTVRNTLAVTVDRLDIRL